MVTMGRRLLASLCSVFWVRGQEWGCCTAWSVHVQSFEELPCSFLQPLHHFRPHAAPGLDVRPGKSWESSWRAHGWGFGLLPPFPCPP